jgi:hypothetical protein
MGKKFYMTGRCPLCDTELTVKHCSKNCEYKYCEYCERIIKRKNEVVFSSLAINKIESV